jgi:hypothetical protein
VSEAVFNPFENDFESWYVLPWEARELARTDSPLTLLPHLREAQSLFEIARTYISDATDERFTTRLLKLQATSPEVLEANPGSHFALVPEQVEAKWDAEDLVELRGAWFEIYTTTRFDYTRPEDFSVYDITRGGSWPSQALWAIVAMVNADGAAQDIHRLTDVLEGAAAASIGARAHDKFLRELHEQDPAAWLAALRAAMRQEAFGDLPEDLESVGVHLAGARVALSLASNEIGREDAVRSAVHRGENKHRLERESNREKARVARLAIGRERLSQFVVAWRADCDKHPKSRDRARLRRVTASILMPLRKGQSEPEPMTERHGWSLMQAARALGEI